MTKRYDNRNLYPQHKVMHFMQYIIKSVMKHVCLALFPVMNKVSSLIFILSYNTCLKENLKNVNVSSFPCILIYVYVCFLWPY